MGKRRQNIDKLTDDQLLWLYVDTRSKAHLGELYTRYLPYIYGLFLKYTQDREQSKSAVINFYEALPQLLISEAQSIKDFEGWMRAKSFQYIKGIATKKQLTAAEKDGVVMHPATKKLLLDLDENSEELLESFEKYADDLTAPQKNSIELFFGKNMSFIDIADQTGYLNQDVRVYIEKGLEVWATKMNEEAKKGSK